MLKKKTVSQCISSDYCMGWNDAVDEMPRWISVEERLPEPETEVLVWLRHIPNIAVYGHDKYGNLDFYFIDECGYRGTFRPAVTHWMPLPEAPKEG